MADIDLNYDDMQRDLSFVPVDNPSPRHLSPDQVAFYNEQGYIAPLDIYTPAEAAANRLYFDELLAFVQRETDRDSYSINGYHTHCSGLYDMVTEPRILDRVEDLVGPDIVCWGSHYFCKLAHDPKKVPWHQDASYWPFDRSRTVTVWLAIDHADRENAAMKFLPGTHVMGPLKWRSTDDPAVLNQEIVDVDSLGEPVYDELAAGQMSLHADMLAHGSDPNLSDRRRGGLTIRYCAPEVRALTRDEGSMWNRNAILCRGEDRSGNWVYHERPDTRFAIR